MICLTSLLDLPRGCPRRPKGPDRLVLTSPLPLEFFVNPRCPPVPAFIKETNTKVHRSESLHMGQQPRHYLWPLALGNRLRVAVVLRIEATFVLWHVPDGYEPLLNFDKCQPSRSRFWTLNMPTS